MTRALLALLLGTAVFAETKPPAPVIGMLNFIHAAGNLEKTVAFYREVFGLEKPNPPRPPNPAVPALINAPGAQLQVAVLRFPGSPFGFELTNFGPVGHKGAKANSADPGAVNLTVYVRELDPIVAAAKKAGAPVVTRSGAPVKLGNIHGFFFRDPDGYIVEVLESAPAADAPAGNVIGAAMGLTVASLDTTQKFYQDLLGFEFEAATKWGTDKTVLDLIGVPDGADFRTVSTHVPGTKARLEFHEFKNTPRTPFKLRIPDPGCPAVALRVIDLDTVLKRIKAGGIKVVSAGGVPAQFSPTIRNIFIEDPDGFKIELFQSN